MEPPTDVTSDLSKPQRISKTEWGGNSEGDIDLVHVMGEIDQRTSATYKRRTMHPQGRTTTNNNTVLCAKERQQKTALHID